MFCGLLDKVKNSPMKNNNVFIQETLLTLLFFPLSYFHVKVDVIYVDNKEICDLI